MVQTFLCGYPVEQPAVVIVRKLNY